MRNRLNKLPLFLILAIVTIVFASCKQTVVINEAVFLDSPADKGDLWGFLECNLMNISFYIWLLSDFVAAFLIWTNGYKVLEWLRKRPMPVKIVLILSSLTVLFVLGCNSYDGEAHYGSWFALPVSVAIGSTCVLAWAIIQRYKVRFKSLEDRPVIPEAYRRQRNLVLLAKTMLWIWCCGWVIFFVAISVGKQPHVGAEVLLRSAIASLDLFLMDIDSNTLDAIQSHDVLKGMISCASFAAVLCTATLIMSLVLSRLMAYMHIKHIKIDNAHNHIYLFFGMNDASKLLAKDVYEKDASSVILFVVNSLAGESEQDEDKTDGWKNIVSMMIHRHKTFVEVDENERRALAIANCDICSLDSESTDVLGTIGLQTVKNLLRNLETTNDGKLHVFFLSNDGESNVRSTSKLAKDALIGSKKFSTTIHCHARRNGINKSIEDMGIASEKLIEVKVVDSSHLAVEFLKSQADNHPVNFVDVATLNEPNPGTVKSAFTSLVVGFGETGQEALSFLYEYAAFVDSNASAEKSFRSPFVCHVIDNEIGHSEGPIIASLPGVAINNSTQTKRAVLKRNKPINFYSMDFRSSEFYKDLLSKIAGKLNYVVIALGDDELNMSVAVDILRYVRSHRATLDKFQIYVRAHEKGTFKHLKEIAQHYNDRIGETKITLFGHNEQIYTYELIVEDTYQENGKKYYETYRSLRIDPENDEGTWQERHDNTLSKAGSKWVNMTKLRRKENQDRSNALHSHTKLRLIEMAVGKDSFYDFISKTMGKRQGHQASIRYDGLTDEENTLMLNLAMCEHLRWNAAHEMLGYVNNDTGHECDDLRKRHNCLKPWEQLDQESDNVSYIDDYKVFDYGVVETAICEKLKETSKQI